MQTELETARHGKMKDVLLIGIDGGATKVSGWIINYFAKTKLFQISDINVQRKYSDYDDHIPGYVPVNLKTQLKEMHSSVHLTREEEQQGNIYMNAAVDVIIDLMNKFPGKKALIGIGMPGLKTPDKRGIVALANGPRMPVYSDYLELKIREQNLILFSPIHHLGSDADFCGIGEEYSSEGAFRNTVNAYYLGGGTGVADAMKLNGDIIPFDQAKSWIAKTWEMQGEKETSLERYISAGGIQSIYSKYSDIPMENLNENNIYPPQILEKALNQDEAAINTLNDVSKYTATLLFERITTIYSGWSDLFTFVNPEKELPEKEHEYRGILLDRIVIGQRLGDLLNESRNTHILWKDIVRDLSILIRSRGNDQLISHYLSGSMLDEGRIVFSKLREAPAIGAGVDAYLTYFNY